MADLREKIKTVLIVVLSLSAVYLMLLTWTSSGLVAPTGGTVFDRLVNLSRPIPPLPDDPGAGGRTAESYELPFAAALGIDGGRYAAAYDQTAVGQAYYALQPVLSEMVGSAGQVSSATAEDWLNALDQGAFFDFGCPLPLFLLSGDAEEGGTGFSGMNARFLAILPEGEFLTLFCKDEQGDVYRAPTAVRRIPYDDALRSFSSNEAFFAFQTGQDYELLPKDQLLGVKLPEMTACRAVNPFGSGDDQAVASLLAAFQFNASAVRKYTSGGGDEVYVTDEGLLTITKTGRVIFEAAQGGGIAVSDLTGSAGVPDARDLLSVSRRLVQAETQTGDLGRYYLRSLHRDENGGSVVFGLSAGGVPLMEDARYNYAVFNYQNGRLVSADIRFLSLLADDSDRYVLPEKQSAGMADEEGLRMELAFSGVDGFYRLTRVFRQTEGGV